MRTPIRVRPILELDRRVGDMLDEADWLKLSVPVGWLLSSNPLFGPAVNVVAPNALAF